MSPTDFTVRSVYLFYLLLGVLGGAAIGSGLMCLLMRHMRGESWVTGRSHCDSCGETLRSRDLIPIASYVLHKGRCRYCGARIPVSCLLAELAFGAAGAALVLDFAIPNIHITCKVVVSLLSCISVIFCIMSTARSARN